MKLPWFTFSLREPIVCLLWSKAQDANMGLFIQKAHSLIGPYFLHGYPISPTHAPSSPPTPIAHDASATPPHHQPRLRFAALPLRARRRRGRGPARRLGVRVRGQQPRRGGPGAAGCRRLRAHARALTSAVGERRRRRSLPLPRRIRRRGGLGVGTQRRGPARSQASLPEVIKTPHTTFLFLATVYLQICSLFLDGS